LNWWMCWSAARIKTSFGVSTYKPLVSGQNIGSPAST
jgi:hypothetical protein